MEGASLRITLSSLTLYVVFDRLLLFRLSEVAFIYVRCRDYQRRVEGIIFFRSSNYLSSPCFLFFFFFSCPYTIITSNRNIRERGEPNERSRWTMMMMVYVFFDSFDMLWHRSHFYHKVNRLSWHRK